MAVKYECPKCGRKFTEWGAEKLKFHCPMDEWCPKDASKEIQFVKAGSGDSDGSRAPSLKRRAKKVVVAPPRVVPVEDEAIVPDVDEVEDDTDEDVELEGEEVVDDEKAVVVVADAEEEPGVVLADDEEVEEGEVEDLEFDESDAESKGDSDAEVTEEEEWS